MKIAIVGATNSVGRELLTFFEIDEVSHLNIFAVENKARLGTQVSYDEENDLDVHNLDDFDFSKVDVAIFVSSKEVAKKYVSKIAKKCKVIDCSGSSSLDSEVPLIAYGINNSDINKMEKNIVAIPSSLTVQLAKPMMLIDEYDISRVVVSMYVSASYYEKMGMDELFSQTKRIFSNSPISDAKSVFNKQVAFNVIPQVDEFIGDETQAEWIVDAELKKIFGNQIKVHANCAFVPSFVGVGQYVNIETIQDIDVDEIKERLSEVDGISVYNESLDGGYFCLADVQGEDNVYISRLRQDVSVENGLSFWSVSDNLRAGIAKNAYSVLSLL